MGKSLLRTDNEIAEIYQRHVKTVYRVCYAFMKNPADTEDAVADTFVKMIKSAPALDNAEHEKAWLIRTATNVCKDNLKRWWRKYEDSLDNFEALNTGDNMQIDFTLGVVCSLPEKYKLVILLYYYDGYSTVQISEILHKPKSTIRYLLYEARKILREKLGGDFR